MEPVDGRVDDQMVTMCLGPNPVKGISFLRLEVVNPHRKDPSPRDAAHGDPERPAHKAGGGTSMGSSHSAWLALLFLRCDHHLGGLAQR